MRVLSLVALLAWASAAHAESVPLPEFTHDNATHWINGDPVSVEQLKGQPAFVHFWAFECWNCYRSFPWLNELRAEYAPKGVRFIGIHTPEFEREKVRESVIAKAKAFELSHPTMLDNDYKYWRSLENRYWPAYYLVDSQGNVARRFIGETHAGDRQARTIAAKLDELLRESSE